MITPLACTMVDWQSYIAECERVEAESPLRSLDDLGLSTKSPASFLATLGGGLTPTDNLRMAYAKKTTDFVQLIFSIDSDEELLAEIVWHTRLMTVNKGLMTLLCGTLTQYMDAIISCSTKRHSLQKLMNALYVYLDRGGFKECFYDYTRESDGQYFTLKHR